MAKEFKIGLCINVQNLITEKELKPIITALKEKGIALEYEYSSNGAYASMDWLYPVIALYIDSEIFRSLVQNGLYDFLKLHFTNIIKTVAGKTYYKLTSDGAEIKQGSISIVVAGKDSASATYNFEGIVSESDVKNSLDAFVKSVAILQPSSNKQNSIHATFNVESNEWHVKSMNELLQEKRVSKISEKNKKM